MNLMEFCCVVRFPKRFLSFQYIGKFWIFLKDIDGSLLVITYWKIKLVLKKKLFLSLDISKNQKNLPKYQKPKYISNRSFKNYPKSCVFISTTVIFNIWLHSWLLQFPKNSAAENNKLYELFGLSVAAWVLHLRSPKWTDVLWQNLRQKKNLEKLKSGKVPKKGKKRRKFTRKLIKCKIFKITSAKIVLDTRNQERKDWFED